MKNNFNKIFGIGLSKTGTTSLTKALEYFGYKAKHNPRPHILYEMVDKYDALTDISISSNYKTLDERYPNSKFILTIRDMKPWLKSCHFELSKEKKPNEWRAENRLKTYGTVNWDRRKFKKAHKRHIKDVMEYFKDRPEDLLVLDTFNERNKWKKLCNFLNKEIPDIEFPHKRKSSYRTFIKIHIYKNEILIKYGYLQFKISRKLIKKNPQKINFFQKFITKCIQLMFSITLAFEIKRLDIIIPKLKFNEFKRVLYLYILSLTNKKMNYHRNTRIDNK